MNPIVQLIKHFRELVSRGAYVFLSNVLEKVTFFFLFILFARSLPSENFGIITASFAVANILVSFFEGGFNFYLQRAVAGKAENIKAQANQIFTLRVILVIPYIIFCFLYFHFYANQLLFLSGIIIAAVGLFSFNNLFNSIYFGLHRYKTSFFLLFISRIVLVIVFITLRAARSSVELITFSFFLSGLVHFILLISALRKDNYHIRLSALRFGMVKNILRASLPMGIGMIFVWIYDRADTLLIQNFLGNSAVAFYAVAYSLYKAPQAFSNFILTPVFTEFSGMFAAEGFIERNSFLKKLFILLTISIFFAFIISLSAKYIIMFFYHSTYYPSVGLLVVLLIALPGLILNSFTGTALNAARKEITVTNSVLISAVVNVFLNVVLLIRYRNIFAAVFATIITEYLTFFIQMSAIVRFRILQRRTI